MESKQCAEGLKKIMKLEEELKKSRDFKTGQAMYTEWLEKALIGKDPENPNTMDKKTRSTIALGYNNRGQLKYLAVDFDGAIADYTKAIELDPELASSYYNKATVLYRMGYFTRALPKFKKAVELSPNNKEFKKALQSCLKEVDSDS